MNDKAKLFQKILAVQKVLTPSEKTGWNDFQKYNYSSAYDVLLPVQRACNEQGLIVVADCIDSKIEPGRASCNIRLTIADSETGESLSVTAPGYAEDFSYKENRPNGDKAIYKAITGATKYAVRSFFCLPSEDDPERTPNKLSVRLTTDRSRLDPQLIEQTTTELKRLGWSNQQGRLYLENTFGKSSRQQLTKPELQQFLHHLRSLPISETPPPATVVEVNAPLRS
ncbi:MAG: ERF family protein [Chroococcidiopsidaceae cyanobacterium CP_BM_RX_35]|nr:ERF family protein [Chroococcidiopsidaceae cyanobacterium CP_BM_RX_35]